MRSLLKEYVKLLVEAPSHARSLRVFDFDDTLVKTKSMVYVNHEGGTTSALTPGEFAVYEEKPGDKFDFGDFSKLVDPEEIKWTVRMLRNLAKAGANVIILTARSVPGPAEQFLEEAGLPPYQVVALGSSNPQKKAEYIAMRIERDNLERVEFFDDSQKNVAAVAALKLLYPKVVIRAYHVKHPS